MSIRKLPFSLEAEQSVLGAILIDPPCFTEVAQIITHADFYLEEHKNIYLAMQELFLQSRDIDLITLIDTLVRKGVYDEAGGKNYIKIIAEIVPSSANVKEYARIVHDKCLLRRLIERDQGVEPALEAVVADPHHLIEFGYHRDPYHEERDLYTGLLRPFELFEP